MGYSVSNCHRQFAMMALRARQLIVRKVESKHCSGAGARQSQLVGQAIRYSAGSWVQSRDAAYRAVWGAKQVHVEWRHVVLIQVWHGEAATEQG